MSQFSEDNLLQRYQTGKCSPEEEAMVEKIIIFKNTTPQDLLVMQPDLDGLWFRTVNPHLRIIKIRKTIQVAKNVSIAASIAIVLAVGFVVPIPVQKVQPTHANDVNPAFNRTILTVSDGRKIDLSDANPGALLNRTNIQIQKAVDGSLVYQKATSISNTSTYHTITTSRGGQYKVVLPDGTGVWLNAATSLSYSTALSNSRGERIVKLVGEAYFEVSKLEKTPFIVRTEKQEVLVLGTHFNIKSYKDEPDTKTTLLEGAVSVRHPQGDQAGTILKPGFQAVNIDTEISVKPIDTSVAVAWKNQEFVFSNEDLESIMREIVRWYDVEISFRDNQVGKEVFSGVFLRYDKISKILAALEATRKVKFDIQDRKITVNKYKEI